MYVLNLYTQVNTRTFGCIWPYIPIYAPFWCLRDAQDLFPMYLHPGSWCPLQPADTAMVQYYLTSLEVVVVPTLLPRHEDKN